MRGVEQGFDILLCLMLLILTWRALTAPHLYQAAIFFIAFGLTMALAWVRLSAPDVALAEAAIGAGLLGVLLVDSLRVFIPKQSDESSDRDEAPFESEVRRPLGRLVVTLPVLASCLLLSCFMVMAIVKLPDGGGLTERVAEHLERSGVAHPVTAVLLNFRGYDTWLEVGVLLLAMVGLFCAGGWVGFNEMSAPPSPGPVLSWLIRGLVPLLILTAAYLLWLGKAFPGGAFQAGVVLGAAGIFLRLAGFSLLDPLPPLLVILGLIFGFGVFLLFGIFAVLTGGAFLEYPEAWAGGWILVVESAAALSIGFTVFAFYAFMNSRDQAGTGDEAQGKE